MSIRIHTLLTLLIVTILPTQASTTLETRMAEKALAIIDQLTVDEKIGQLMNDAPAIERLGIPSYNWWSEALHGVARNGRATVFPQPIGMAATFDTALVRRVAEAIALEGRAKFEVAQRLNNRSIYAGLTYWSPNVNIFRDPRWGRGQETYGEDPFLSARMGVAFVKGLQGEDPFFLKAAACAKHFAVHSGPEALRHSFNANPSKKDLFETYLPAFEALVKEANVESVMGAYNRVYGASASGSPFLLTDILRKQWGFSGHVVSDCGAIEDIYRGHKLVPNAAQASAIAIKSGLNLECGNTFWGLKQAFNEGLITENDLDNALYPLMMTRLKLGILTPDDRSPYAGVPASVIASEAHAEMAREAARNSMVLLKNANGTLPLSKEVRTMYVTGPFAADASVLLGNYFGLSPRMSTFLEGIVGKVSSGTSINYKVGTLPTTPNLNPLDWTGGEARNAEVCVIVMGLSGSIEGEEGDAIASPTLGDKTNLSLPTHQLDFLRTIAKNHRNKVVTVITGGSPMDLKEVAELSDAVILAWYPGQEGGNALGDLLFGDAAPSGRLPITFPLTADSLPPFDDYSMKGRTYKYMTGNILYPFGYGLTYSNVAYSDLTVSKPTKKGQTTYKVTLTLKNTGTHAAVEVPQLYLTTPGAGVSTPLQSLIGFQRVALEPGEQKEVTFDVNPEQLKMVMEDGSKRLLKGTHTFTVSAAAPSPRNNALGIETVSLSLTGL
jgi:beta-glucosidase